VNVQEYQQIIDYLFAAAAFSVVAWARYMFNRVAKCEKQVAEQTKELHDAIDHQGEVFREEHSKLREQMTEQHNKIVDILINQNGAR